MQGIRAAPACRRILAGVALAAAPLVAAAQSPAQGLLDNAFVLEAGLFGLSSDIRTNVNGPATENPEVNLDARFGKSKDARRARVDALWRVNERHHLRALYFNNDNRRTHVLNQDLAFGEYVFLNGSSATVRDKSEIWELAYEYAFARGPNYELAATVGVHVTDISLQVSGTANTIDASGKVTATGFASRTAEALAPLPVIGLRGGWAVSPQWYLSAQAQVFSLKLNGYDGNWLDLRAGATWMFHRNFGVGLGYNRFDTRLDVRKSDYDGRLKFGYHGVQAFLTGTF